MLLNLKETFSKNSFSNTKGKILVQLNFCHIQQILERMFTNLAANKEQIYEHEA